MKIIYGLVFLIFIAKISFPQSEIFFTKEDLTFEVNDSVFVVEGIYYFDSNSDLKFPILYPFPADGIYSKPFNIKVYYVNTNEQIDYKMSGDSSAITFPIIGDKNQPVYISYSQKLKSGKAKYILTTTKFWSKPLGEVNYKLITELNFEIGSFSIPPDKSITLDGKKIYLWSMTDFLPKVDFEIEF